MQSKYLSSILALVKYRKSIKLNTQSLEAENLRTCATSVSNKDTFHKSFGFRFMYIQFAMSNILRVFGFKGLFKARATLERLHVTMHRESIGANKKVGPTRTYVVAFTTD